MLGGPGVAMAFGKAGGNFGFKAGSMVGEHGTKALNAVSNSLAGKSGKDHPSISQYLNKLITPDRGGQDSRGGTSRAFSSIKAGGTKVDFTKGGWPTSQGYSNINKKLGTNFNAKPLKSPLEYAQRDAQWRRSITGSPDEWLDKPKPGHSQDRWKSILDNRGTG